MITTAFGNDTNLKSLFGVKKLLFTNKLYTITYIEIIAIITAALWNVQITRWSKLFYLGKHIDR